MIPTGRVEVDAVGTAKTRPTTTEALRVNFLGE
jgi:hypothetical protein